MGFQDEDESYEKTYSPILLFLWAMEHDKTMIKGNPTAPVSDQKILKYAVGINAELNDDPQEDPCTSKINKQLKDLAMNANSPNGDRVEVALHRFLRSLDIELEAKQNYRSVKKLEKDKNSGTNFLP